MSHPRKTMCPQCPFNKAGPGGYIGPYSSADEIVGLVMSEVFFPCHMEAEAAVERDEENSEDAYANAPACAGSLQFMKAMHKLPRDAVDAMNVRMANLQESLCRTPDEVRRHHARLKTSPNASDLAK